MIDHIVVDVEIANTIEQTPGGWNATDKLGVAVACVWQYNDQRMRIYGPDDVKALQERLLDADRITSYNGWNFDYPVIWGIDKVQWTRPTPQDNVAALVEHLRPKTNDLLRRIWIALGCDPDDNQPKMHRGCKLDDIVGATLGVSKIGNGADAPKWYQQGLIQKVCNYCADDVALERDLSDFIDKYGYVIHNGKQLFLKK